MANIEKNGAPGRYTKGNIGDTYTDLVTGNKYECIGITTFGSGDNVNYTYDWRMTDSNSADIAAAVENYLKNNPIEGSDGVGIQSIEQTATSTADNGNNEITVTLTNGQTKTFTVKNGSKGSTGNKGDKGDKGDTGARGPAGSDATVTSDSIESALGYTPADASDVSQLSDTVEELKDLINNGSEATT